MTTIFDHFDSWEPLFKARKAKGLDKWERLRSLSERLQGKGVKDISFTCCHPSHSNPIKHVLGSVEGNLHFLLGYGNPDFHMAPYHWQVIDPNLTDEEAKEMHSRISHPGNPKMWKTVTLPTDDEGDIAEGSPHPERKIAKDKAKAEAENRKGAIVVESAAGTYVCLPRTQMVYGMESRHSYTWPLVKDTFFAKRHPEVAEAMESAEISKSRRSVVYTLGIPENVKRDALSFKGQAFAESVWPLVKSRFHKPGKILTLENNEGATLYGVVTDRSIQFYNKDGSPALVKAFDRDYVKFELSNGGTPPAVLFSFLRKHVDLREDLLQEATESMNKSKMADNGFTEEEAKKVAKLLKLDMSDEQFSLQDFCEGLNVELEHSNVTKKHARATGKIALAHLRERPDYYKKLKKMEKEPIAKSFEWVVEGSPSEGWDSVSSENVDFEKSIKVLDGILKVVRA